MISSEVFSFLNKYIPASPYASVSDRQGALSKIINGDQEITISVSQGSAANFFAVVQKSEVRFTYSAIASIWCLCWVSYRVFDEAMKHSRPRDGSEIQFDIASFWHDARISEYLQHARNLMHADAEWPSGLPIPSYNEDKTSTEWCATNLTLACVGWAVLHEIGHISLKHDNAYTHPHISQSQEYEADKFATAWLLNTPRTGLIFEFRIITVAICYCWLLMIDQERGIGDTHPPSIHRFSKFIEILQPGDRSVGLEISTYVLKAIFLPDLDIIQPMYAKQAFEWLVDHLQRKFTRRE